MRDATPSTAPRSRRRRFVAASRRRCRSTESLRQFMLERERYRRHERTSSRGTRSGGSALRASRPLRGSSGFPIRGVRRTSGVSASRIVTPDERHAVSCPPDRARPTCRRRWSPASLHGRPGIDLGGEPGMIRGTRSGEPAPDRRGRDPGRAPKSRDERALPGRAGAEPRRRGTPPWVRGGLRVGHDAASGRQGRRRRADRGRRRFDGRPARGKPPASTFTVAGQRFDVVVPEDRSGGAAASVPWIILVAGFVLAGLAGGARRQRARGEPRRRTSSTGSSRSRPI